MHKIPRGTFKNAQNPMRNCQICTKSHEEVPKCTKSHEELPKMQKKSADWLKIVLYLISYAVCANYVLEANTTKGEEEEGEGVVSIG